MRTGFAITCALLMLVSGAMLWLLERRARLSLQAAHTPAPQGLLRRISAAAEHPDFVRSWIRPAVVGLVALFAGQLLNLAGCNTTPTQTRLGKLEDRVQVIDTRTDFKDLDQRYEPREELDTHQHDLARIQDMRDKQIERLQNQYDALAGELLRRSAKP